MPRQPSTSGNQFGVEAIANLRDVAGSGEPLVVAGGAKRLKAGVLYRSSLLTEASADDRRFLIEELGIKTYIDLRTPGNPPDSLDSPIYAHFSPSPLRSGKYQEIRSPGEPRRISAPIGKGFGPHEKGKYDFIPKDENGNNVPMSQMTPEQHVQFLAGYNIGAMTVNSGALAIAMKALCDPANYPVLFGCLTGKDRTGLVSCLALAVCGASRKQIFDDYMRSDDPIALMDNARMMRATFLRARALVESGAAPPDMDASALPTSNSRVGSAGNADSAQFLQFQGSATKPAKVTIGMRTWPAVMKRTFAFLDGEHGGAGAYLRSIGITQEDQETLRSILLEDCDVRTSRI